MGHQPTVFVGSHPHNTNLQFIPERKPFAEDRSGETDFPWIYVKTCNYEGSKLKRVWSMLEYYRNAKRAAKAMAEASGAPDAIVGSSAHPLAALLAIRLGKKYHCKGIVEVRDLWPESIVVYGILSRKNPIIRLLYRFEKYLYTKADDVIFTMEGGKDYIVEQGWDKQTHGGPVDLQKVHHINNGVDLEQFHENRDRYQLDDPDLKDPDTFKIIYAGSIRRVNHLGLLLDAAKQVKNPRVKFLVWGDGDERALLEQRIQQEGISNVVLKGHVDKKYIPYLVSRADLNLLHGFPNPLFRFGISPNKLFDYFAAGKVILMDFSAKYNPVSTTRSGFVCAGTPGEIAAAIQMAADQPEEARQAMCENALRAASTYDFSVLVHSLLALIEE